MSRPRSRSASNSGNPARAAPRLAASPRGTSDSARCSCTSTSAALALSLNAGDVMVFMGAHRAAKHLAAVAHRDPVALAREFARHVHQAAEVAGQQDVGAGGRNLLRL